MNLLESLTLDHDARLTSVESQLNFDPASFDARALRSWLWFASGPRSLQEVTDYMAISVNADDFTILLMTEARLSGFISDATALANALQSAELKRRLYESSRAVGKIIAVRAGLSPDGYSTVYQLAEDVTAVGTVAASAEAMAVLVGSEIACAAFIGSSSARRVLCGDGAAMAAICGSSVSVTEMMASPTRRRDFLASPYTATIWGSETAVTCISDAFETTAQSTFIDLDLSGIDQFVVTLRALKYTGITSQLAVGGNFYTIHSGGDYGYTEFAFDLSALTSSGAERFSVDHFECVESGVEPYGSGWVFLRNDPTRSLNRFYVTGIQLIRSI